MIPLLLILIALCTFALLSASGSMAERFGLIDLPGGRKVHSGGIPLVGGLAIYCVLWVVAAIAPAVPAVILTLMACSSIVVIMGAFDDRFGLPVLPRLLGQGVAAYLMMEFSGLSIHSPLPAFGVTDLEPSIAKPLTVIAVVGLMNAFNMIDGIDGLAGSVALVCVFALALGQFIFGYPQYVAHLLIFGSALVGYLAVNLCIGTSKKVFLGDAGSLLIGFVLAWAIIGSTQAMEPPLAPSYVIWAVALPVFDIVAVMLRRVGKGLSPFKADRTHLHHICLRAGLNDRQALGVLILFSLAMALFGGVMTQLAGPTMSTAAFGIGFLLYLVGQARIWKLLVWYRRKFPSQHPQLTAPK